MSLALTRNHGTRIKRRRPALSETVQAGRQKNRQNTGTEDTSTRSNPVRQRAHGSRLYHDVSASIAQVWRDKRSAGVAQVFTWSTPVAKYRIPIRARSVYRLEASSVIAVAWFLALISRSTADRGSSVPRALSDQICERKYRS